MVFPKLVGLTALVCFLFAFSCTENKGVYNNVDLDGNNMPSPNMSALPRESSAGLATEQNAVLPGESDVQTVSSTDDICVTNFDYEYNEWYNEAIADGMIIENTCSKIQVKDRSGKVIFEAKITHDNCLLEIKILLGADTEEYDFNICE